MSKIKIQFDEHAGQTKVFHAETGERFHGVLGFILIVTPQGYEAKIITEEPLIEGNCTATVTEQLVISSDFLSTLANLVARKVIEERRSLEGLDEMIFQHLVQVDRLKHDAIGKIADEVEKRLTNKAHLYGGTQA